MSFIKPISFWQQPRVAGVTPAAAQNIYLSGYNFYKWKGTQLGSAGSGGIAKINLSGTLDTTFATNANPSTSSEVRFHTVLNNYIYADYRIPAGTRAFRKLDLSGNLITTVPTSGGTIWGVAAYEGNNFITITGDTTISFNGTTIDGVGKINEDLTVNTTFATNIGTGPSSFVYGAVPTSNRIAVCGGFANFNGNTTYERFVILNHDGTRDTGFTRTGTFAGGTNIVYTAIFIDNKWIVVGSFTSYNGVTNNRILAFNSDGSVNTTFTTNIGTGFNGTATAISRVSDTQVVVAGDFTTLNGNTVNRVALINTDGTIPTNIFGTGFSASPYGIQVGTDGKFYASGASFTSYNTTNTTNNFISLNSDGSVNTTFATGSAMQTSTNGVAELGDLVLY